MITHTATTHPLDAVWSSAYSHRQRNTRRTGQNLGLHSGWPSTASGSGHMVQQMWTYAQSTFHTEKPEAPVSYRAPPDLGEPPLRKLSPLSWCKVVRLSLVCHKGSFTKAAWPYMKAELSTCIETMTMTHMTCSNLLSHSNASIYPNPSNFPIVTKPAQSKTECRI